MRNFSGVACACDIGRDDNYGNGDNDGDDDNYFDGDNDGDDYNIDGDNDVDGDNDGDMTTASVAKVVPVPISPPQRG